MATALTALPQTSSLSSFVKQLQDSGTVGMDFQVICCVWGHYINILPCFHFNGNISVLRKCDFLKDHTEIMRKNN